MRNFFLFLQRYSHFILFLFLESISFYAIYRFNIYHHAVLLNSANDFNGYIISKRADITKYFQLNEENEKLLAENSELRKKILESYYIDQGDTIRNTDTTFKQKFTYIPANVIQNSTDLTNNYIMIDKGSHHGIGKNMGVICPEGIVGIIVNTSENFSIAMSVLNSQFSVTPKLSNNTSIGKLIWKGNSPYYANIERINRFNPIKKGDIVQTSPYSSLFPENVMIGKVAGIKSTPGATFLTVRVKLSTDFTTLRSVYVINNLQIKEIESLENQINSGN